MSDVEVDLHKLAARIEEEMALEFGLTFQSSHKNTTPQSNYCQPILITNDVMTSNALGETFNEVNPTKNLSSLIPLEEKFILNPTVNFPYFQDGYLTFIDEVQPNLNSSTFPQGLAGKRKYITKKTKNRVCSNPECACTQSTTWRFEKDDIDGAHPFCSACALYRKSNGVNRPHYLCKEIPKPQILRTIPKNERTCKSCGCGNETKKGKKTTWRFWLQNLLCNNCYQRVKKYGDFNKLKKEETD